jgi:hypothetical protein
MKDCAFKLQLQQQIESPTKVFGAKMLVWRRIPSNEQVRSLAEILPDFNFMDIARVSFCGMPITINGQQF